MKTETTTTAKRSGNPGWGWLLAIALLGGAFGCAATRPPAISQEQLSAELGAVPAPLHTQYKQLRLEGPRNEVLNQQRIGLSAMEIGEKELAARSFDRALLGIEAVYANNEDAKRARSLWHAEGAKDFKGEPYERSMAYMYRGLLYMADGDYENARASFKAGQLQDQLSEKEEFAGDFASLDLLAGFASKCNGDTDLANEFFDSVASQRPGFSRPQASDNVLIVAETGAGPEKLATGAAKEELRFRRGSGFTDERVGLRVNGRELRTNVDEDLYYQASTRGSRPIDKILAGHAQFKEANAVSGQVLALSGMQTMRLAAMQNNGNLAGAGAAVALFGIGQQLVANAMKAEADTRTWESLPDQVHFATASVKPGTKAQVEARFLTASNTPIEGATRTEQIVATKGKCGVVWLRSGSAKGSIARGPSGFAVSAAP